MQEGSVEPRLLRLQQELILALQLAPQKGVLGYDFLAELGEGVAVLMQLVEFLLEEVEFVLVGHEEGLEVVEFLQVLLGVDEVDVFGAASAQGQPRLVGDGRQLFGELLVCVVAGVLMCSL